MQFNYFKIKYRKREIKKPIMGVLISFSYILV